jgi:transaldolase
MQRTYRAHCELINAKRWKDLEAKGARKQRMLWASTGTKDPKAPAGLYVEALAAPDTIDTMPDKTLLAFAESGNLKGVMAKDGGDAEETLGRFAGAGIDVNALAAQLQVDGAASFVKSWTELMKRIEDKSAALATT